MLGVNCCRSTQCCCSNRVTSDSSTGRRLNEPPLKASKGESRIANPRPHDFGQPFPLTRLQCRSLLEARDFPPLVDPVVRRAEL